MRKRRTRWTLTTLVALLLLVLAGSAGAVGGSSDASDARRAAASFSVTLITGDRVELTVHPNGRQAATVDPAPRGPAPAATFDVVRDSGDLYVFPSDAAEFLDDELDRELFNVSELVEQGLHDAASSSLPVIVDYERRVGALPPALDRVDVLESIDAAVATEPKADAADFGRAVAREASAADSELFTGVEKIWLDGEIKAALDESVPQIGAPAAWAAGFDGTGVTVAVLDTGIDAAHPDVAGKIVASRSFIANETVADGHGHGTHVASTIVGTGAGSDGRYKGVAPGANLVVGKAISNAGTGPTSGVIAAMEWAVLEQDADLVNMSLGTLTPSDGTDPASQALDNLTAQTGTLFVVAAGNLGPAPATIAAPGAADDALTVGAVDKSEGLAGFSSRGPRLGDHALKPEIAAPGVSVTAARAAGTTLGTPENDLYTTASGTSMATPHVAGAAAILVQRHPDWSAAQLKAALVATSADSGHTVYQQGAGRVDVPRALGQAVQVSPAKADFGFFPWPQQGPPVSKTLTYANPTGTAVTLDLALTASTVGGVPAPPGALTVDADTLTVPAGGSASATLTLDPTAVGAGTYTGRLVATAPGDVHLTTPVGFVIDEEKFTLGVRVLPRANVSQFTNVNVQLYAVEGSLAGESTPINCLPGCPDPIERLVPAGTYSARAFVRWFDASGRRQLAVLIDPEIEVRDDVQVTLDANDAELISYATHRPTEPLSTSPFSHFRSTADGSRQLISLLVGSGVEDWWITPTEPVTKGGFWFATHVLRRAPTTEGLPAYIYPIKIYEDDRVPESVHYRFGSRDVASIDNRFHAEQPGTAFRLTWFSRREGEFASGGVSFPFTGPVTIREYVAPLSSEVVHERRLATVPPVGFFPRDAALDVFSSAGSREIDWNTRPNAPGPVAHPLAFEEGADDRNIAPFPYSICGGCRQGDAFYPFMHPNSSEPNHALGRFGTPFGGDTFRLFREGVEVPQAPPFFGAVTTFLLPPEAARYRLTHVFGDAQTAWDFSSSRVTTDATPPGYFCAETYFFNATTPCRAEPLLFLRYDAGVDLANTVPAERSDDIDVSVYRQAATGPTVAGLQLWVSFDDGASWAEAKVHERDRGEFEAKVKYPVLAQTTGAVSLKAVAWDIAGNRIEQTLTRAYGLREPEDSD